MRFETSFKSSSLIAHSDGSRIPSEVISDSTCSWTYSNVLLTTNPKSTIGNEQHTVKDSIRVCLQSVTGVFADFWQFSGLKTHKCEEFFVAGVCFIHFKKHTVVGSERQNGRRRWKTQIELGQLFPQNYIRLKVAVVIIT
uniref:Uncharacterized protein n=1 Tax=Panagrellus redivivus TaxID=6233 RepID=A0A7E4ZUP1_PANRE